MRQVEIALACTRVLAWRLLSKSLLKKAAKKAEGKGEGREREKDNAAVTIRSQLLHYSNSVK